MHVDCETFSRADLPNVGAARYARDPSTLCLMVGYQIGSDSPRLWDRSADPDMPFDLFGYLDGGGPLVAFNAGFEREIFAQCLPEFPRAALDPDRWQCAQALALSYGLPADLGGVCGALRIDAAHAKDPEGKKLIRLFSMPQKTGRRKGLRVMPGDEPEAWTKFGSYCVRDVVAEAEVYRRLTT